MSALEMALYGLGAVGAALGTYGLVRWRGKAPPRGDRLRTKN